MVYTLQTKETLSLRATSFGSKCELSDKFIKKVADSGVADGVLSFATFKQNKEMKKTDGAKRQRITGAALHVKTLPQYVYALFCGSCTQPGCVHRAAKGFLISCQLLTLGVLPQARGWEIE